MDTACSGDTAGDSRPSAPTTPRVQSQYLPTHPLYEALWVIRVAPAPLHAPLWTAIFSHGSPGEVVAAFTEALAYDLAG
ncbi:DUF317 domain-containing protein [Streptomyces chisholmiae]|uniref:DUF317 domain-containing protein n=1 Tax=Streptomyces chisholmiae TaxID=3075540 RepID=UPI00374E13C2